MDIGFSRALAFHSIIELHSRDILQEEGWGDLPFYNRIAKNSNHSHITSGSRVKTFHSIIELRIGFGIGYVVKDFFTFHSIIELLDLLCYVCLS